jgi:hypothetical protein
MFLLIFHNDLILSSHFRYGIAILINLNHFGVYFLILRVDEGFGGLASSQLMFELGMKVLIGYLIDQLEY